MKKFYNLKARLFHIRAIAVINSSVPNFSSFTILFISWFCFRSLPSYYLVYLYRLTDLRAEECQQNRNLLPNAVCVRGRRLKIEAI